MKTSYTVYPVYPYMDMSDSINTVQLKCSYIKLHSHIVTELISVG